MKSAEDLGMFQQLYYRLIALWVICEGVAGGIMHGLNIPFSGMIISGSAVVCICLIAHFVPVKGAVLKATIIVMIFKMMLSPHTPPTAYIAVLFQGIMGQTLFSLIRYHKIAAIILGVLALVESAIQRILVMVILYGGEFWNAVNEFIKKLLGVQTITNYTFWLAGIYILVHAIAGVFIGLLVGYIINKSKKGELIESKYIIEDIELQSATTVKKHSKKKGKLKKGLFFIWMILLLLFLQSIFKIGEPILPSNEALMIFVRSLLIIFVWYYLVSPLLIKWINQRLKNKKEKSQSQINAILLLLPSTEYIFRRSWEFSSERKGFARLGMFWKIVVGNTLHLKENAH
ncbi:MAG: hypothetical protein ABI208_02945 [Ginsengibacter sp.]|jgi:hypothetical protein